MPIISRYLTNNLYYVGRMDGEKVTVSFDGADEFDEFPVKEDENGKYFEDEGHRVDLKFAK